jgi:subtilase family serine protease
MTRTLRWAPLALALSVGLGLPAGAEESIPGRPLITASIDESRLVEPEGNTRPEVTTARDLGRVEDSLPLEHVHLQLRRSAGQEAAVEAYVDGLTNRSAPQYHQWLNAAEFGKRFGVAESDIAKISGWLEAKGLTVNFVYPSRMVIDFSGTAGQVSRAFATEIHRFEVAGTPHIANTSNPKFPEALAPAIQGIVSLHDFRAHNKILRRPKDTGCANPNSCSEAVAPGDLQTIYDITRLYTAGYDGKGQVIAVAEDTNLYNNSDFTTFRSTFGLTSHTTGALKVQHPAPAGGQACQNPGVTDDDVEATLDVEWASAAAPGATILLASCNANQTNDGVYLAIQNLVNSASPPPVISVSYGICETQNLASGNAAFNKLYQQAVAAGISVFVATGDNGPTDCSGSTQGTTYGIGINGWADSQYNVAVGGTDFGDTYADTNSTYWKPNAGKPWSTAKSYIPEIPWNDTCASGLIALYYGSTNVTYGAGGYCNTQNGAQFLYLGGGEGGPSGCYSGQPTNPNVVSGTCKGYPKPSFQSLVGVPADGVRDIPDVALFASDGTAWGHNYATCFTDPNNGGAPCTGNPATWATNAGGTSYATPIMAAIQALVDQFNGGPQGNPLPNYYSLAKSQYGKTGNAACAATKGNKISASCIFHDIVTGDDDVDCKGTNNCFRPSGTFGVLSTSDSAYKPAYKATVGYDCPTGIGSVDAANLALNWPTN